MRCHETRLRVAIVEEVRVAVAQWPVYAGPAGVVESRRDQMQGNLRLDLL